MRIVLDANYPIFDESKKLNLLIYPNPANTSFAINGNFNGTINIDLYSMEGKKVLSEGNIGNDQPVYLSGLAKGIYIYKVTAGARKSFGKLIVN